MNRPFSCIPGFLIQYSVARPAIRRDSLIQRDTAADVGRDVEVFTLVNRRLALVEAALGTDGLRQLGLTHFGAAFPPAATGTLGQDLFALFRRQSRRRRAATRTRPRNDAA